MTHPLEYATAKSEPRSRTKAVLLGLLLVLGALELAGALLWCVAGAGMYGSPLTILHSDLTRKALALLIVGPMSLLPATLVGLRWRWAGGAWLLFGALASAYLGVMVMMPVPGVMPTLNLDVDYSELLWSLPILGGFSLPMLALGIGWICKAPPLRGRNRQTIGGVLLIALLAAVLHVGWPRVHAIVTVQGQMPKIMRLDYIAALQRVTSIEVRGSAVTDAHLVHLRNLSTLKQLDLRGANITDQGMAHLKTLTGLEFLTLSHTGITDAGLRQLEGLVNLKVLELDETKVTENGVLSFQEVVPGASCNWIYTLRSRSSADRHSAKP